MDGDHKDLNENYDQNETKRNILMKVNFEYLFNIYIEQTTIEIQNDR